MRVGYYVSTDYWEEEYREMETPPNPPLIHKYAACLYILGSRTLHSSQEHLTQFVFAGWCVTYWQISPE